VVVALVGGARLERLLASLRREAELAEGDELVVVGTAAGATDEGVRWLSVPAELPVPQRRAEGFRVARGRVVALLEDTVALPPGWARAVRTLHDGHPEAGAIGGSLSLSPELSARETALALLEYGRFLRAGPTSESSDSVPGSVMSFRRDVLERLDPLGGGSLREADVVRSLLVAGTPVRLESSMGATCVAVDPRGARPRSRFAHGRLYAGQRFASEPRWRAVLHALLCVGLPALLGLRCARVAWRAGAPRWPGALVHVAWMSAAWSLGEAVGCLWGPGEAERLWI
jgi:hypothetical protein